MPKMRAVGIDPFIKAMENEIEGFRASNNALGIRIYSGILCALKKLPVIENDKIKED